MSSNSGSLDWPLHQPKTQNSQSFHGRVNSTNHFLRSPDVISPSSDFNVTHKSIWNSIYEKSDTNQTKSEMGAELFVNSSSPRHSKAEGLDRGCRVFVWRRSDVSILGNRCGRFARSVLDLSIHREKAQ